MKGMEGGAEEGTVQRGDQTLVHTQYRVCVVCVHWFCVNLLYVLCPFTLDLHCSSLDC